MKRACAKNRDAVMLKASALSASLKTNNLAEIQGMNGATERSIYN